MASTRHFAFRRAGRKAVWASSLRARVKHLREGHDGSVIETAHPVRPLERTRVGGPGCKDRSSLGLGEFRMVKNFIRMG